MTNLEMVTLGLFVILFFVGMVVTRALWKEEKYLEGEVKSLEGEVKSLEAALGRCREARELWSYEKYKILEFRAEVQLSMWDAAEPGIDYKEHHLQRLKWELLDKLMEKVEVTEHVSPNGQPLLAANIKIAIYDK